MSSSAGALVERLKLQIQEEGHGLALCLLCESLRDPLILEILSFLNKASLLKCASVSRRFYVLATDSSLRAWQSLAVYKEGHFLARLKAPRYSAAKSAFFQLARCGQEIHTHCLLESSQEFIMPHPLKMPPCLDFLALSGTCEGFEHHADMIISAQPTLQSWQ
ncbi:hypothetical protein B484DRAFT_260535 [Ochromonadaceae sp. CCMP2298]|nr:hypothetical protein B484DRAFT_260535 [Ochromonadaceae sp. CCMP2298]